MLFRSVKNTNTPQFFSAAPFSFDRHDTPPLISFLASDRTFYSAVVIAQLLWIVGGSSSRATVWGINYTVRYVGTHPIFQDACMFIRFQSWTVDLY